MAIGALTGYVHALIDEKMTAKQFALTCARAFGATITMRDDAPDAQIPTAFEVDSFYESSVKSAVDAIRDWRALTDVQRIDVIRAELAESVKTAAKRDEDRAAQTAFLSERLADVMAWEIDPEIKGLKDFMIEQIEQSIPESSDFYAVSARGRSDMGEGVQLRERDLINRVAWAQESLREEEDRIAGRNAWLRALWDSLATI